MNKPNNDLNKRQVLLSSFVFVVSKFMVFLTPIFISTIVSQDTYGVLETSLSVGSVLAPIVGVGSSGSFSHFFLSHGKEEYFYPIYIHFRVVLAIGIGISLVFFFTHFNWLIGIAMGGIMGTQISLSGIQKARNKPAYGFVLESGTVVIVFFSTLFWAGIFENTVKYFDVLMIFISLYCVLLIIVLRNISLNFQGNGSDKENCIRTMYGKILRFGAAVVLVGFCTVFLTSGGRLLASFFVNDKDVAQYGILWRLAGGGMLVSQLFVGVLFAKIYLSNTKSFNYIAAVVLTLVGVVGYIIFEITGIIQVDVSGHWVMDSLKNSELRKILALQMVLWSSMSLMMIRINRHGLFGRLIIPLVSVIVFGLAGLFLIKNTSLNLTIISITKIQSGMIFCAVLSQIYLTSKVGESGGLLSLFTVGSFFAIMVV